MINEKTPATALATLPMFLFIATSLVHLLGELSQKIDLQNITKPFLLPLLAIYFIFSVNLRFTRQNTLIFIGLLFSFFGDTLLIFVDKIPSFFVLGLLSFLVTHICYLVVFLKYPVAKSGLITKQPYWLFPFILFLTTYMAYLLPAISKSLKIPVMMYSLIIVSMACSVLNLKILVPKKVFQSLFLGALLFVISDSILAFNKFHTSTQIPLVGFWIMLTYITGQYLIVHGAIQLHR
jgi:uncharacterized membrane protein YhhN